MQSAHPWKPENGVQIVTVTLENLGNSGVEVPFKILFESGEVTKRIEVRAKSTATTRVEVPGMASEIVVNDGSVPESDLTNNGFQIPPQLNQASSNELTVQQVVDQQIEAIKELSIESSIKRLR